MEDIFTDDTMSKQERDHLEEIAESAAGWFNAVEELRDKTSDSIQANPLDTQLSNFNLLLNANYASSEKLHQWANNNLRMGRFPANSSELRSASSLVAAGKGEARQLQESYRHIVGTTSHFEKFMTIDMKIRQIQHNNRLLHTLLFRAEGAVSAHDCSVNLSFLRPMSEG